MAAPPSEVSLHTSSHRSEYVPTFAVWPCSTSKAGRGAGDQKPNEQPERIGHNGKRLSHSKTELKELGHSLRAPPLRTAGKGMNFVLLNLAVQDP